MRYKSMLAELTLRDLQRIHSARQALRAVYEAIKATSIQAKPAIFEVLDRADDDLLEIFRKGAPRAVELGNQGAYSRLHPSPDFIAALIEEAGARGGGPDGQGVADAGGGEVMDTADGDGSGQAAEPGAQPSGDVANSE